MQRISHTLPHPPTSFVGREAEITAIISLLNSEFCRLLTLVGPGGIGKSRLALRVGEQLAAQPNDSTAPFPDGVVFVAFQPLSSVDQIVPAIAKALDWKYYEGRNPLPELLHYLQDKRLLLILDNFEQLVASATLLHDLLDGAPGVKLLVTSRVVLNLAEEWLYHVDGMSLPTDGARAELETSDAVKLFRERARRVRHDFSLDAEQAQVVQICRLVDGTPLAIELAATWLRSLPSSVIAAEIQSSLEILQTDQMGVLARHRTMRAVFDHSWRLLDEQERKTCQGLSIFQGGFLREAAEQVVGTTLPVLSALADKSMLRVSASGRFSMHELQRQYAAERLNEWPEWQREVRDRHCSYYLGLIAHPALHFLTAGSKQLLDTIEADHANIFAAWDWAADQKHIPELEAALGGMYWYAWLKSRHSEGEKALATAAAALSACQESLAGQMAYAHALELHGAAGNWLGLTEKTESELRESVALLRGLPGARHLLGMAIGCLGWALFNASDLETARPLLLEAVEVDTETEQYAILGFVYCLLGSVAYRQSDYQESEEWYQRALALGRQIDDYRTIAHALRELGLLATGRGTYGEARHYLEEALAVALANDLSAFVVTALGGLGQLAEITGDLELAEDYLQRSLNVAQLWGKAPTIAQSLLSLAHLRTTQGDYAAAKALYHQAAGIVSAIHSHTCQSEYLVGLGEFAVHMGEYGNAQRYFQKYLALSRTTGDRLDIARASVRLGLVAVRQGAISQAKRYLLDALREGLASGFLAMLANGLVAAAELCAVDGDLTHAALLASVVRDHAASSATARKRARRLLADCMKVLADETQVRATQECADREMVTVAQTLMVRWSQPDRPAEQAAAAAESSLLEPLSERELQILRMVAAGQSNRQISRELYLTLGTVKSHLHHINRKLDVQRRTQAVARARELRLL